MDRIKTDRRLKGECMCMWFIMSFIPGVALCHAWHISGIAMFRITALICGIVNATPLVYSALKWAVGNQIEHGVKYAWKHYWLVLGLRKHLLDAGIYTTKRLGAVKWAEIPWVVVDFAPDFKRGTVWIKNSIQFNDRLGRLDISPSLGRYVVEQVYLTDDANHYRFDFYDSSLERRLVFDSFEAFKARSDSLGSYELFIDSYTKLTLTHQLMAGQTGSGKSYALHGYLLQMLLKPVPYRLYFADPKSSSVALFGERVSPETTADDFDGIVALLETFVSRMQERQKEMKSRLSQKIDGDYRDFGLSPHVLVFDEYADFSLLLQSKDKQTRDRGEQPDILNRPERPPVGLFPLACHAAGREQQHPDVHQGQPAMEGRTGERRRPDICHGIWGRRGYPVAEDASRGRGIHVPGSGEQAQIMRIPDTGL